MDEVSAGGQPPKPVTRTGTKLLRFVPLPSWPSPLLPQQETEPSWWSAQECPLPAVMAVATVMPVTCTGTELLRFVPLPSWPELLRPQQDMVPSWWSAQECPYMSMAVASVMPETCTGTADFAFLPLCPLPSRPLKFQPQQDMVPFWRSAQEWSVPAVMAVASEMLTTFTGNEEIVPYLLSPLPSWPSSLRPQQDMVPSWWSAQECTLPAAIAVASEIPRTCTGTKLLWRVPSPSWPSRLRPQQDMEPFRWSAQE